MFIISEGVLGARDKVHGLETPTVSEGKLSQRERERERPRLFTYHVIQARQGSLVAWFMSDMRRKIGHWVMCVHVIDAIE